MAGKIIATRRFPVALKMGLVILWIISLSLRFWGLDWFNTLIFDEVYYVKFAVNYLNHQPFFDAHPPLGKYLIALGIWLSQGPSAWLHWPGHSVTNTWPTAVSYRWINALWGSTLPPLTALIAYGLSRGYGQPRRIIFSLLAGGLMMMEGLTLVESRLGLINIYWLWFGLCGQICWLNAKHQSHPSRWYIAAGVALGAAMAVKWNGAAFWLGVVGFELLGGQSPVSPSDHPGWLRLRLLILYGGLVPALIYGLIWIPHLQINHQSFWDVHRQIWAFHQAVSHQAAHPYCSAWFTWPLMLRPVAYFYQPLGDALDFLILAPARSIGLTVYSIQGMGNPLLWWAATGAMVSICIGQCGRWFRHRSEPRPSGPNPGKTSVQTPVETFVLINYGANWLPWMLIHRCTFLYLYMGALTFSLIGLAWLGSGWLGSTRRRVWVPALMILAATVWGFYWWLPVFLGLPLSPEALQRRWWLSSWI